MVFVSASIILQELHYPDITSAFLQDNDIKSKVFIWPPWEITEEEKISQLQRCKDIARAVKYRVKEKSIRWSNVSVEQ